MKKENLINEIISVMQIEDNALNRRNLQLHIKEA